MTIQENIKNFQEQLRQYLNQHEQFLDNWATTDCHQRTASLHVLLHQMWSIYEKAEDNMHLLTETFPPYPFHEIETLRKWLRNSIYHLDVFLYDSYHPSNTADHIQSYNKFLLQLRLHQPEADSFVRIEQQLLDSERELLDMLNRSYSILLELLTTSHKSISSDPTQLYLSYINCRTRYEQLTWPKQKKLLEAHLNNRYPWDNLPNISQLQEEYATIHRRMSDTVIGQLFAEYPDEIDFVLHLSQSGVSEEELGKFFLSSCQLAYFLERINELRDNIPSETFCTYIVPNAGKSREEIEADLLAASQRSAAKFREFLHNYRINGYLDFRHESPSQIYTYLNNRYSLPYDMGNFTRDWNV